MTTPNASLVKWVPRILRDDGMIAASEVAHYDLNLIEYIKVADLTEVVEGLMVNIARSFINADEISAYRLACEHILTQLEANKKE